ncbi:hypothetical protein I546_2738 [Mycobacterium kansasii 732]|nr:hypothetical protein I546_2738 [Mycobacterium kansasii 732]
MILGAWGALVPFIGPRFDFAYTPGQAWTAARGWLEVLPGVAAAVGGLLLIISGNRAIAMLGGWLAALAGAWFVVGTQFARCCGSARWGIRSPRRIASAPCWSSRTSPDWGC